MKTKSYVIMTGVVLLAACSAQAVLTDKTFTSSGQILPGEEWSNVYIYNDDTVVDVLGGFADYISTYDGSTLNVFDGQAEVGAFDYSSINISGGELSGVQAMDDATIYFSNGATSGWLDIYASGTINVTGGSSDFLRAGGSGTFNLYGGYVGDFLSAWDVSVVNVYGYGFSYDPLGGAREGGQLTGMWLNDTPFSIDLYDAQTYEHINLIPEPSCLALLAVGALFAKRCY
jgi:hypothetical protein